MYILEVVVAYNTSTQNANCSGELSRVSMFHKRTALPTMAVVRFALVAIGYLMSVHALTPDRRAFIRQSAAAATFTVASGYAQPASAKDRTEGYAVQHSDREWSYMLSGQQYNILRQGGTERPNSSILESEDRPGMYSCAGCGADLFDAEGKFHSGTGWPSFANAQPKVEVQEVNPVQMSFGGAEIRCGNCGGHLGDVFLDGKLFVGTPAFQSGKRFCVDGYALVFKPEDGSDKVFGDTPPLNGKNKGLPSFLEPPKINAQSRV